MAGISCWQAEPERHEEVRIEADEAGADSFAAVRRDLGSKIAELERRVKLLEESSGSPDKDQTVGHEVAPEPETGSDENDEARYEFTMSMWDAGMLLFLHKNNLLDRFVLVLGMVLNVFLQAFLFFVVVYNMLDNDFSDKTIQEMVSWRVNHGHNSDNFDVPHGKSYAALLCAHQLWTFEGQEYGDMYNYLYRAVPGAYLSILAILLWILSTMAEYRRSVSQFFGLLHLPRQRFHEECLSEDPSGDLRVCGISTAARWAAIVLVCLPRVVLALALMLIGCKYLAQTVTLSDIVLNTVALSFVMDVDEYLANVILTDRLQNVCGKIQPVSCGRKSFRVRDLLRYAMIFGMLVFAIEYWVNPFNDAVAAASAALCGGDLDFSYVGGTSLHPDITLMPTTRIFDEYTATCPTDLNLTYHSTYYPGYSPPNGTSAAVPGGGGGGAPKSVEEELLLQVVRYAFSADGCGPGMIHGPPADASSEGLTIFQRIFDDSGLSKKAKSASSVGDGVRCVPLPARLRGVLPSGVHPGEDPVAADCRGFDASLRGGACAEPEHPGVCVWTWEAQACEGTHPGGFFRNACRSSLWRECETWEGGFNTSHPTKNCEIARQCSPEAARCLEMDGWITVAASDASAFVGSEETLRRLWSGAFEAGVNVSDPWSAAYFYIVVAGSPIYHAMRQGTGTDGEGACNNSCQSALNNVCDEPLACAPGTDYADCKGCPFDCIDTEPAGGSLYETCRNYHGFEAECGTFDSAGFAAGDMCCACGGGLRRDRYMTDCAEQGADCIFVYYHLLGVGEGLRREDILGANASIIDWMNAGLSALTGGSDVQVLRALFNEASMRAYPSLAPPGGRKPPSVSVD